MLTSENIREVFDCNLEKGELYWKVKHTKNIKVGKKVGNGKRYPQVMYKGKMYLVSRLIFLWANLRWPVGFIDHIDRNPLNNAIHNLREATPSQNAVNSFNSKNKTGVRGVHWCKFRKKYVAAIRINGKSKLLGRFSSLDEAKAVYQKMAIETFGKFANV